MKTKHINYDQIIDSLEVLKKLGGVFGGYGNPPTEEEIRYDKITEHLRELPFSELKKLMKDSNYIRRFYGFQFACMHYFDSLTTNELEIFKDSANVMLYTPNKIFDSHMTLGSFCESSYSSKIKSIKRGDPKQKLMDTIKEFIEKYASYPKSYKALGVDHISWTFKDEKSEDIDWYEVELRYKMKTNQNKSFQDTNYFVFDSNYNIKMIKLKKNSSYETYYPKIEDWLLKFGRKLNDTDSINLNLK